MKTFILADLFNKCTETADEFKVLVPPKPALCYVRLLETEHMVNIHKAMFLGYVVVDMLYIISSRNFREDCIPCQVVALWSIGNTLLTSAISRSIFKTVIICQAAHALM